MRRLARWTLNALTVLSLALFLVTVGVWLAGPAPLPLPAVFNGDPEAWPRRPLTVQGATASWNDWWIERGPAAPASTRRLAMWGFDYERASSPTTPPVATIVSRSVCVTLPGWAAAALVLPGWRVARRWRRTRSRRRAGHCPSCDYDLTGNSAACARSAVHRLGRLQSRDPHDVDVL